MTAAVDWFLERVLEAAALLGPAHSASGARVFTDLPSALDWLETERENLVRAVALADAHDLIAPCWQLADALFRFYDLRRYLPDWQQVNETAMRAARRAGDRAVEGRMRNGIGTCTPSDPGSARRLSISRQRWRFVPRWGTGPERAGRSRTLAMCGFRPGSRLKRSTATGRRS